MTDLQTTTAMLARAGIGFEIETTRENGTASANGSELPRGMTLTTTRVDEDTKRSFGYYGFYCELYFDSDGALVGVGAWE
jgi:hypothetical protein